MPTLRMDMPEQSNTEFIVKELDTTDELREIIATYQRRLENLYNKRKTLSISTRKPGLKESLQKYNRSSGKKVSGQLGRALYYNTSR